MVNMFTGIIQGIGTIKDFKKGLQSGRMTIETQLKIDDLRPGDSMAVDGVCLTITDLGTDCLTVLASQGTIKITTLGGVERGKRVNLEKAVRPSDFLGGHIVTGHVDGPGTIVKKTQTGDVILMAVRLQKELRKSIVHKGSIAVDGISLTVKEVIEDGFEVSLIPFTIEKTTLSLKGEGDTVNIETDILGKYVERFLASQKAEKRIDSDFLAEHGFLK